MKDRSLMSEKLLSAIGEIDDELIREAAAPYELKLSFKRISTIAATLTIVTVIAIAAANILPAFAPAGDSAPWPENSMSGGSDEGPGGSHGATGETVLPGDDGESNGSNPLYFDVAVSERGTDFIRLKIGIYTNAKLNLVITGENQNGEKIISTTMEAIPEGYIRVESPKITVDGVECDSLPDAPGEYEVTVSYAHLLELGYAIDESMTIEPGGTVSLR